MRVTDRARRAGLAAATQVTITCAGQTHTVPVTLGTLPGG